MSDELLKIKYGPEALRALQDQLREKPESLLTPANGSLEVLSDAFEKLADNLLTTPQNAEVTWPGTLHTDGWAGRRTFRCQVIGETKARYLITTDGEEIQLPRSRMYPGQTAYVPKTAVTRRLPNAEVSDSSSDQ